jgi:hypothetical protein
VFENRILRKFRPKRDGVTAGEDCMRSSTINFSSSPDVTRMVKSRRMRWARYGVCMGEMRNSNKIWLESLKKTDQLEEMGIDGRIILKWILQKHAERA